MVINIDFSQVTCTVQTETQVYNNHWEATMSSILELAPELEVRLQSALRLMGYEKLYPEQTESVLLNIAGKQTLTLLSTGGGKTACYVIPGLVRQRITIVISPLIALQNDQVNGLVERGIPAFLYNSNVADEQKEKISSRILYLKKVKKVAFLFVSPESLISERFMELFGRGLFDFMAIDEVHCVSTWGNSFRPDYQRLVKAAKLLEIPLAGGYTAISTPKIREDIFRYTPLIEKLCRVVKGESIRPNLHISVVDDKQFTGTMKERADAKKTKFLGLTKKARGAAIVYCGSRQGCESLYDHTGLRFRLRQQGYTSYVYHAEIIREEKDRAQRGFDKDRKPLVFATNAFGMGIDRSDVGLIVHYNNPRNLLGYAQEIGRSGRDGEDASCVTFFDEGRLEQSERYQKFSLPTVVFVEQTHVRLQRAYLSRKIRMGKVSFSTSKFMRMLEHTVRGAEDFENPDRFIQRTRESIAILKHAGYINEDGDEPFQMYEMNPGTKRHGKLIEFTQMTERSEVAQAKAVADFFTAPNPNQELLWQLLG